jgi:hypothetical protein
MPVFRARVDARKALGEKRGTSVFPFKCRLRVRAGERATGLEFCFKGENGEGIQESVI